ncbi:MAG: ATP-binding cassette domain-containing protein, partial [Lactobacillus sp.]|nr:ATP-binding cassette domain-containing protein [Lactobacillus sp.]
MTNVGIQVKQISKHYRHKDALKGVSLNFAPGKIYGLLGRNGAGKSTLLNIIANRIFPSSGDITFDGVTLNNNDQALG